MKEVRSLIGWMLIVMILLSPLATSRAVAQPQVNGKVSWEIEKKAMTLQEAQAAIGKATTLKVYMVFEGDWVKLIKDQNIGIKFRSSSFSYGIAEGATATSPLYKNNPPAYMGALSGKCSEDGIALDASRPRGFISDYGWMQVPSGAMNCPIYDYGILINGSGTFDKEESKLELSADGKSYRLYAFDITFYLKRAETVYVRGIDDYGTYVTDNASDFYATSGINEINLADDNNVIYYWPDAASTSAADWTTAPTQYYGGVIPGGIFIEQSPEVAQLTPVFFS